MPVTELANDEAAIMRRLFEPSKPTFSVAAARAILAIDFLPDDKNRMNELAASARAGRLTSEEEREIDSYSRVGSLLSILKSKACRSLKARQRANGKTR